MSVSKTCYAKKDHKYLYEPIFFAKAKIFIITAF